MAGRSRVKRATLDAAFGKPERGGGEWLYDCPFCPAGKDPKLSVALAKQVAHCFRCGYSGRLMSLLRDAGVRVDLIRQGVEIVEPEDDAPKNPKAAPAELVESLRPLRGPVDPMQDAEKALAWQYLAVQRGIPVQTIRRAGACVSTLREWSGYVLFPVYDGVERKGLVYVTGRAYLPHLLPQRNPARATMPRDRGDVVYGEDRMQMLGYGVLCEAPLDALRTSPFAGATLGTRVTRAQVDRLLSLGLRKVVVYFDREPAAQLAAWDLAEKLDRSRELPEGAYVAVPPGPDPGDCLPAENEAAVRAAVRYSPAARSRAEAEIRAGALDAPGPERVMS